MVMVMATVMVAVQQKILVESTHGVQTYYSTMVFYSDCLCETYFEKVGHDMHDLSWKVLNTLQATLLDRPLSYTEILTCWAKAVIQLRSKLTDEDVSQVQEECDDYANAIIMVVGTKDYKWLLQQLLLEVEKHHAKAMRTLNPIEYMW